MSRHPNDGKDASKNPEEYFSTPCSSGLDSHPFQNFPSGGQSGHSDQSGVSMKRVVDLSNTNGRSSRVPSFQHHQHPDTSGSILNPSAAIPFSRYDANVTNYPDDTTMDPSADQHETAGSFNSGQRIFSGYLRGQLCNVAKAAVWWSTFGVLVQAITEEPLAVGLTRLVFNLALVLVSPIAGTVAEKASVKYLLNITTIGRLLVWFVFVPSSWVIVANYYSSIKIFFGLFLFLMFIDGVQVSFANVVDIDCGGLETLAQQYDIPLGDYLRNRFNSIHQVVFDLSFIVLTPPVAFAIWEIGTRIEFLSGDRSDWARKLFGDLDVAVLVFGICGTFCVLSIYSLWCYYTCLVSREVTPSDSLPSLPPHDAANSLTRESPTASWKDDIRMTKERLQDVKEGFFIVCRERALGWRLIFLAVETALEDAMVSVVIPEIAIHMIPLFWFSGNVSMTHNRLTLPDVPGTMANHWTSANLMAVAIIAVGKAGGLVAGAYMNTRWMPPANARSNAYKKLFWSMLLSSTSVIILPLSYFVLTSPVLSKFHPLVISNSVMRGLLSGGLVLTATFFFFVFSTAPKIGFATLLQSLVVNADIAAKVFGFVGTFVTIADAAVILGVNSIFYYFGHSRFQTSLLVVALVYLVHGLAEALLGPLLILNSSTDTTDSDSTYTNTSVRDFPNLFNPLYFTESLANSQNAAGDIYDESVEDDSPSTPRYPPAITSSKPEVPQGT